MQGIVSGGLLVLAFAVMAGLALLVTARLYRISRSAQSPVQPSAQTTGRPGEPPDA